MIDKYRTLIFDASRCEVVLKEHENEEVGPLSLALKTHLYEYKSYEHDIFSDKNVVCLGTGILASRDIAGVNELVITFRSPISGGLYVGRAYGIGRAFLLSNIDFLFIKGRSKKPLVLGLRGRSDGSTEYYVKYFNEEQLNAIMRENIGMADTGARAFARYVVEHILSWFMGEEGLEHYSLLSIGPSSLTTKYGGMLALTVIGKDSRIIWHGIIGGGLGSVMYKAHGVIALVFGGNGKRKRKVDTELEKIVYDIKKRGVEFLKTGYVTDLNSTISSYISKMNILNWRRTIGSVNLAKRNLIDMYVRDLRRDLLNASFATCGDICPIKCKMFIDDVPLEIKYMALAGTCGIFSITGLLDSIRGLIELGFEPEEFMVICSILLELVHTGIIKRKELGLTEVPVFDVMGIYDGDSEKNAHCVIEIAQRLSSSDTKEELIETIRLNFSKFIKSMIEKVGNIFAELCSLVLLKNERIWLPQPIHGLLHIMPLPIRIPMTEQRCISFHSLEDVVKIAYDSLLNYTIRLELGLCDGPLGGYILEKIKTSPVWLRLIKYANEMLKEILMYNEMCGARPLSWCGERYVNIFIELAEEGGEKRKVRELEEKRKKAVCEYLIKFYNELRGKILSSN